MASHFGPFAPNLDQQTLKIWFYQSLDIMTSYHHLKLQKKTNDLILRKLNDGWTNGWTDRQGDRQTDQQTDRETDRETDEQTGRQTDTKVELTTILNKIYQDILL